MKERTMKHTIANKLILLATLVLATTACVVTPPTHLPPQSVEMRGSIEPRVQFGSRSQVSIWLHPQYALPDAYVIAQNHCRRWGLWADPYNDWAFSSPDPRVLNYHCARRRPVIVYPHVTRHPHVNRHPRYRRQPVVVNPPRRREIAPPAGRPWGRPRPAPNVRPPRVITPEVRQPRRPTLVPQTQTEVGKPWEYNTNKNISPRRPKTEVGKPWEYNTNKNQTRGRNFERRESLGSGFDRGPAPSPDPRPDNRPRRKRSTLTL